MPTLAEVRAYREQTGCSLQQAVHRLKVQEQWAELMQVRDRTLEQKVEWLLDQQQKTLELLLT